MSKKITKTEFEKARKNGDVGIYKNFFGKHPEWAGRRTLSVKGDTMDVRIEGVSFEIVPDDYQFFSTNSEFVALIHAT